MMKAVGLRELKNRLSEYIRDVRGGESVLVTDRGEVVAEIGPPGHRTASSHHPPGLQALARRGLATLGEPNGGRAYRQFRRVLKPGRAAALLAAERGGR
jgi:antitoxin (DNA-binding transcriptional repressor) of toxin-antitoxin stability system